MKQGLGPMSSLRVTNKISNGHMYLMLCLVLVFVAAEFCLTGNIVAGSIAGYGVLVF